MAKGGEGRMGLPPPPWAPPGGLSSTLVDREGVQRCPELVSGPDQPCQGTLAFPNVAKKPVDLACGFLITLVRNNPGRP